MLVYRKSYEYWDSASLRRELCQRVDRWQEQPNAENSAALLLRAGELEAALADLEAVRAVDAEELTDLAARLFVGGLRASSRELKRRILGLELPERLTLRRPEGYAYYALDPMRYAELARGLSLRETKVTVIGIRSIGTSLSAVVSVALRERGLSVARVTVRPRGHPYERVIVPDETTLATVRAGADGEFVVADEGPGRSGSSFLAAATMLSEQGVPDPRVTFLCSHEPDPTRLIAPAAAQRWSRFRKSCARGEPCPSGATDVSAGSWRRYTHLEEENFPASWPQCERVKFLFTDSDELHKFVGIPPYGERAVDCANSLAQAGFSPAVLGRERGFIKQRWQRGRCLSLGSKAPLARIAEYLCFRRRHFELRDADSAALEEMMHNNVAEALDRALPPGVRLELTRPVHVDGRLAPHEWLETEEGRILKTDCGDHGDDHLYPGPCDIAWDLAGAIVEWELDASGREDLIARYHHDSGDDPRRRIAPYEIAYAAFKLGCARFALHSSPASETLRLAALERRYSRHLTRAVASL